MASSTWPVRMRSVSVVTCSSMSGMLDVSSVKRMVLLKPASSRTLARAS